MVWFRYLGKQKMMLRLCQLLAQQQGALHPVQIARALGVSVLQVQDILHLHPEFFVKLPRNADGLICWRLTSSTATLNPDEVETLIATQALREKWQLTAFVVILLSAAVLLIVPASFMLAWS